MSIKTALFGEPEVEEVCNKIARDKKLTDQEKLIQILDKYINYFNTKYVYDINFGVYQNYYEYFASPEGVKDDEKYEEIFNDCIKYQTMSHMENLHKFYVSLIGNTNKKAFNPVQAKLAENLESFGKLEKIIQNQNNLYGHEPKVTQAFDVINDKTLKDCTNGILTIYFFDKNETLEK